MKKQMKYRIRRLIATIVLLAVFMTFTISVLVKGIDNEFQRQDVILEQHFKDWGIEK